MTRKVPASKVGGSTGFSSKQIRVLVCLAIAVLVLVSGLGFVVAQSIVLIYQPPVQAAGPPQATATRPPPTWTAASSPTATATPLPPTVTPSHTPLPAVTQARPTATLPETPTPVPSLTPYHEYWRTIIGHSVEGRPIEVHRFGNGARERMIIAGIHGGSEWNTTALAYELIAYLEADRSIVPAHVSLFILPLLNPDGEARAHSADGRTNANGVDLNRNFDADWRSSWPRHGCWNLRPTTSGTHPGSEPETQAVMEFLLTHNVDVFVSYHSAALGIFPSGHPPHPDSVRLAQEIASITPYIYPPVDTGCIFSGTLVDWALQQGIIAVDLELRTHTETEFEINLKVLSLLLGWQP